MAKAPNCSNTAIWQTRTLADADGWIVTDTRTLSPFVKCANLRKIYSPGKQTITLTETQIQIRDTARPLPGMSLRRMQDRDSGAVLSVGAGWADGGVRGPGIRRAELTSTAYALAIEEISAADGGISNYMAANNSPVAAAIDEANTDHQKREYLTRLWWRMARSIHLTGTHRF